MDRGVATGKMRYRVEIQVPTRAIDSTNGADTYTFATAVKRWASIEQLTGEETYAGSQVIAAATHKLTMRCYKGLTERHRIKFGSREFQIKGIWKPEEISNEFQVVFVSE